jgi:spore maturation protein CgeB
MVLNEYCPELEELFKPDKEIITFEYGDVEGVREKLGWYLSHEDQRRKIALAGCQRAHRQHSFMERVKKILEIIRDQL